MVGNISPDNFMKCSRLTMLNAFLKSILRRSSLEPLCLLRASGVSGPQPLLLLCTPHRSPGQQSPYNFLLTRKAETLTDETTNWVPARKRADCSRRLLECNRHPTCNERNKKVSGGARRKLIHAPCQLGTKVEGLSPNSLLQQGGFEAKEPPPLDRRN